MKRLSLYAISTAPATASDNEFRENIVTFVTKKKQVMEYVNKKLIIDHYDHYKEWCKLKDLDKDDALSEAEYLRNCSACWNDYEKYTFKKFTYTLDEIASIFRITNKCVPVGAYYETDTEVNYMNSYLKCYEEVAKLIQEDIDSSDKI